jgi:hypothetical protein
MTGMQDGPSAYRVSTVGPITHRLLVAITPDKIAISECETNPLVDESSCH